jgi:hypothetical protein
MVAWDRGETLADRFRSWAGTATHVYGYAMRAMADDWDAGGPARQVFAGYEDAPNGSAVQLRLLGGVFRLVLTGRAPELVPFYPCLGGTADPAGVWPVLRAVLDEHTDELHGALEIPPQTNEVGRSAALLAGLFDVVGRTGTAKVRLLEVGASAGLNLLVDRLGFSGQGWRFGPVTSPVQFADPVEGNFRPVPFSVVERGGCDLNPIEAASAPGRLLLTSFVWPFDVDRHERLTAALQVGAEHPVTVDRAAAGDWLARRLDGDGGDDVLTVVWHSITRLYWPAAEIRAVDEVLADYGSRSLLARVSMEFGTGTDAPTMPELRTTVWIPGRGVRDRLLGTAHHHGVPVRLGALSD